MTPVLEGLSVIDLSSGIAGPVTTMLLSDYGAAVTRVERPGGDPFRDTPAATVWNRGKRSVVLDLTQPADHATFLAMVADADVVVESYAPGTTARLGIDEPVLRAVNPRLVLCSITGYGRHGEASSRPGYDALVQARSGMQYEQPGLREGPIFLHTPLPSFGAALLASVAVNAALHAREVTGRGQWVETSLLQGALVWTTQLRKRAETPTPPLVDLWKYKHLGPTPCFEAGDGLWFHPMPQGVPVALAHVGRDPMEIPPGGLGSGDLAQRTAYFAAVTELYLQRPRAEWVALLQGSDVSCQPVGPALEAFDHPQVRHNGAVVDVDIPGVGTVTQFGHGYQLERHRHHVQGPPASLGQHTEAERAARSAAATAAAADVAAAASVPGRAMAAPLDGIRVLDFGTALAGPFGPMILSDLGADVIKIDPITTAGTPGDATYAACMRGKRSIAIDLKAPEGQAIARTLIASADVVHYNLRTGVAERLGFGYEQARAIRPDVIFCHVTGYGNTGPLASWPGVDQMGQALGGLEYEQGATPDGGHPTWYRFGMCDATTGLLSVLGVLQALRHRDRTGEGQAVETNILNAGLLLASDVARGPSSVTASPGLDRLQTGLGPLYRLYETAEGWICLAACTDTHWRALCRAIDEPGLADDPRFATAAARADHAGALADVLAAAMAGAPAEVWRERLDAHGVPCEIASPTWATTFYDDPDAIANGWVSEHPHPVWGRLEQPGRFFSFSDTPSRVWGPPPVIGQHTQEILDDLGYKAEDVADLRRRGVVAW